jgi:Ulp1 family protease
VEVALKSFTAVITVINYPKGHWVTLQFDPKKKILEVFDSMAPKPFKNRMEEIDEVRYNTPTISPNIF